MNDIWDSKFNIVLLSCTYVYSKYFFSKVKTVHNVECFILFYFIFCFKKCKPSAYIKREDPDIFCVQETKCSEGEVPKVTFSV